MQCYKRPLLYTAQQKRGMCSSGCIAAITSNVCLAIDVVCLRCCTRQLHCQQHGLELDGVASAWEWGRGRPQPLTMPMNHAKQCAWRHPKCVLQGQLHSHARVCMNVHEQCNPPSAWQNTCRHLLGDGLPTAVGAVVEHNGGVPRDAADQDVGGLEVE